MVVNISENPNSEEEYFRQRYAVELRKKTALDLEEERKRVKQQSMKTPGRRGEHIKHEELDKEMVRRYTLTTMTGTRKK